MRIIPFILLALLLGGCASFPKQMTGQFNAQGGDFIVIKGGGALYWSPLAKTDDQLGFVGIIIPDKRNPQHVELAVASGSPYLGTSLRFASGYSRVTIDWGKYGGERLGRRSTEFERVIAK